MGDRSIDATRRDADAPRCRGCEQSVDTCAFCERETCPEIVCYQCMIVDLREAMSQPHGHGG